MFAVKGGGTELLKSGKELAGGESLVLDAGRLVCGDVLFYGNGDLYVEYVPDPKVFDLIDGPEQRRDDFHYDGTQVVFPELKLSVNGVRLHELSRAFRFLRLRPANGRPVRVDRIEFKPSGFTDAPDGTFDCSDPVLTEAFRMGLETVRLCTQPAEESCFPMFVPFGQGFVQWDGVYRDREVWGGDLRPASLAWFYNFRDSSPVANSLYCLMSAQHTGCSEHGLFPGSGSTHQIYYEWAFWEAVCLWEHYLHTGDPVLLRFARYALPRFLDWMEKKLTEHADGWLHTKTSWMYTLSEAGQIQTGPMPGLQAAAAIGLDALISLFRVLEDRECVSRAQALRDRIGSRFHETFWDETLQAYRFVNLTDQLVPRSVLDANCWAVMSGLAPRGLVPQILESMRRNHWTAAGSLNIAPVLNCPETHDGTVWPYINAYEVTARFHAGDAAGALEVLRRYTQAHLELGHHTLFEFIRADGSLPLLVNRIGLNSFCHAWSAQGSWALQRYLLGAVPLSAGWKRFSVNPVASGLEWIKGSVVTPHGLIHVELEARDENLKGTVRYPGGCVPDGVRTGLELIKY